jgi:hypothetical protein
MAIHEIVLISTTAQTVEQPAPQAGSKIWTISVENLKGINKQIYCEVAETEQEKRRGLMFRDKLERDECMIFLYDSPIMLSFWMKNTYLPLSIAFVGENLKITDLFDMKPFDENIITSTTPGIYAIEVNRGWFKKNLVYQGSKITIIKQDLRKK